LTTLLTIDNWTVKSSKLIKTHFENPKLNQKDLAKLLGKTQSNISAGLKRSGFDEISQMLAFYNYQIKKMV
jgi:predicted XRE-type DNA-binding protein